MQSYLQQLLNWADSNNMVVNFDKTKEMIMGSISKTSNFLPLTTDTGLIEQVNSFKLLGLHLDSNFSWSTHVETILSKATQRVYFLKQLKRAGVPHAQLLHFYLVVIRPVLEYAAPVWHHLITKTQTEQIETIQRRAIRIIYSYTYDMPYTNALYIAQISSLADRREQLSRVFSTRSFSWHLVYFKRSHQHVIRQLSHGSEPLQNFRACQPAPKNISHSFLLHCLATRLNNIYIYKYLTLLNNLFL